MKQAWTRSEKQMQKQATIALHRDRERKQIDRDVVAMERELRSANRKRTTA